MNKIFEAYTQSIREANVDYEEAFYADVTTDEFSGYALAELALDSIPGLKQWIKKNRENLEDFSFTPFKKKLDKFFKRLRCFRQEERRQSQKV
jgi:hypothetical protein